MKIYSFKNQNFLLNSRKINNNKLQNITNYKEDKVKYCNMSLVYFQNISFGIKSMPICAYKEDGTYKIFTSICEAAKELGCKQPNISIALKKGYKVKDYRIIELNKVSYEDENGLKIDENKILELSKKFEKNEVYIINKDGECKSYKSIAGAKRCIKNVDIYKILNAKTHIGNITAAKPHEVISYNNQGNKTIDNNKLNKILKRFSYNPNGIYVIFQDGSCKKYKNQTEAAKAMNVTHQCISNALSSKKDKQKRVKKCLLLKASDIERIDKNGDIELNIDLIAKKLEKYSMVFREDVFENLAKELNGKHMGLC